MEGFKEVPYFLLPQKHRNILTFAKTTIILTQMSGYRRVQVLKRAESTKVMACTDPPVGIHTHIYYVSFFLLARGIGGPCGVGMVSCGLFRGSGESVPHMSPW